ncbi:MAG: alpha-amylase family glycosyl hydrolase [Spirochaetes bacterium]|nr:alpha-amylase family glycosyl hydrolase [Spirochaetota bacterium]
MLVLRLTVLESSLYPERNRYIGKNRYGNPEKEFHISRTSREKYQVDEALFTSRGNVIFPNYAAVRIFARNMNRGREAALYPERSVRAGDLNAMGLIDEILHYVVTLYTQQYGREIFQKAVQTLEQSLGRDAVNHTLLQFVEFFPPLSVYRGTLSPEAYLERRDEGVPNRETALEELLLLWLANENPAFSPFRELFEDEPLRRGTSYLEVIRILSQYFQTCPTFGPDNQPLVEMLQSPVKESPHSLSGQLDYIRRRWGLLLGSYLERLLRGMDFIREETKLRIGVGPGPVEVYRYTGPGYEDEEVERFSMDRDWMPSLVLIAKSTLVWLDQLSKKYGRDIRTLDAIPDEELDWLAQRGINGLWLIGIWERSRASKRIKELCGNPDAEASAYSLYEYEVAWGLGGWAALENLKQRAWKRGIRLASDMVPNHTGIDSRWVIEHPEWFIQTDKPPFPNYTFNGENLSHHPDVGIFLEDHYYDRTDAAVVFKRVHWPSGETRYIYHGNDGTHMPWNDTAQLNFLLPDLREAVIQTILHVARTFPIIRFDAAMTLTKRHYQRLWFPEPGTGGDIPSRSEFGMTKEEFNRHFPVEFWREVVDRAARECPDTLLLAEAFWMMEGYFVRTLGMHRVYNSAFMNMLKNEENAKYRWTIKNTQEFDRNILKRFVNFMNNPDEETAIAQFGDGDKYFGVCTLMVTLPGLPMFGHGQIEGFREKYGMEFKRAYWDEKPNQALIERHEREIFPLLHKRYLFAEVDHFLLYDLFQEDGKVNENVFAFSNRKNREAALVLYNNALPGAAGWIYRSSAYAEKDENGGKVLVQKTLAEGLGIHGDPGWYCIFREQRSNLWFIREGKELSEKGLFVSLRGYESQVFFDFYEVYDGDTGKFARLCASLNGRGTPSIEDSLRELVYTPLYRSLRTLLQEGFQVFRAGCEEPEGWTRLSSLYRNFLNEASLLLGGQLVSDSSLVPDSAITEGVQFLQHLCRQVSTQNDTNLPAMGEGILFLWGVLRRLGFIRESIYNGATDLSRTLLEEWCLEKELEKFLRDQGLTSEQIHRSILLVKIFLTHEGWWKTEKSEKDLAVRAARILQDLLSDQDIASFCGVNTFEGVTYFHLESFLEFCQWMDGMQCLFPEQYPRWAAMWKEAVKESEYRVDLLLDLIVKSSRIR